MPLLPVAIAFYGHVSKIAILPVIRFESRGTVDKNRGKCLIFVYRTLQN